MNIIVFMHATCFRKLVCVCVRYIIMIEAMQERENESVCMLRHFLSLLPLNKLGGRMNYYGHAELSQLLEKHNTIIIPLENVPPWRLKSEQSVWWRWMCTIHNISSQKNVFAEDITMHLKWDLLCVFICKILFMLLTTWIKG